MSSLTSYEPNWSCKPDPSTDHKCIVPTLDREPESLEEINDFKINSTNDPRACKLGTNSTKIIQFTLVRSNVDQN